LPEHFWLLLLIGLVAGLLSGMFGIGGGIVIVPALITLLAFGTTEAVSTSLAALLLPVGIFAVLAYHRAGLSDFRAAGWIALGIFIMSWVGARLALGLPGDVLKQIYGSFLVLMSWRFLEPRKIFRTWQKAQVKTDLTQDISPAPPSDLSNSTPTMPPRQAVWYGMLGLGMFAGVTSGMFGIGGGIIIVPVLAGVFGFDQKHATGISLTALLLPVALPAVVEYYRADQLDIPSALPVAVGLVVGALGGAKIALGLPSSRVRQLYGLFILLVGIRFILGY
jgi:uncharacterized membrane protein YfcA